MNTNEEKRAAVLKLSGIYFARGERQILSDISWEVGAKQVAAILGANGCGKSTFLRLAVGYLWPQRGSVELLGERLGEVPVAPLRARTGIVEANTVYPFDEDMTALQVVTSGYFSALTLGYIEPSAEQFEHARHMLDQVGLGAQAGQLYFTMSTGQRMRALIARALVRKPELLLLDEPTAGLDLPGREAVLATLARLQKQEHAPAMVTVTHHLEELLPGIEHVLLLSTGGTTVAQGRAEEVLTDGHLSAAYGVPIHVTRRHNRYGAHVDPRAWDDLL